MGERFFFHLRHRDQVVVDRIGVELPSALVASERTRRALRDLAWEDGDWEVEWQGWTLEVVDSSGQLLMMQLLNRS